MLLLSPYCPAVDYAYGPLLLFGTRFVFLLITDWMYTTGHHIMTLAQPRCESTQVKIRCRWGPVLSTFCAVCICWNTNWLHIQWIAAYKHQTPKLVKLSFETGTLVIKGHDFASTVISSCFYILVLGYVRVVPCAHIFCSGLDMGARAWEVLLILLESLICPLGDFVKHLG